MASWIFDPPPDSGAISGGVSAQHVFEGRLDTFVREALQNSGDQQAGEDPVHVRFRFQELTGDSKNDFLSALGWNEVLRKHFEGVVAQGGMFGRKIAGTLESLKKEPLRLLRIDDWNTVGLTGDEDATQGNFAALCRHLLVSSEERRQRGGSFGLGKAVLTNFSGLSTVLFSSRLSGEERGRFRLIGKTELPHHSVDQKAFRGPGWFGAREELDRGSRAVSLWDEEADSVARKLQVYRDPDVGSGTTIMLLAFAEPETDEQRGLREIAEELLESAIRWFWPAICVPPGRMKVEAEVRRNGETVYRSAAERNRSVEPFIEAASAATGGPHASAAGEVGEETIEFELPARTTDPAHDPLSAPVKLRVVRRPEDSIGGNLTNRIALYRGAQMVVAYISPSRKPLDNAPFYGVLRTGTAVGFDEVNQMAELFFRAAEPPAHNSWKLTESLRVDYQRGSGARLNKLMNDVDKAILRLCGAHAVRSAQGPEKLARYFPIGGRGGGHVAKDRFTTSGVSANLQQGRWVFEGTISRHDGNGDSWGFVISPRLDGESGPGSHLRISSLEVEPRESVSTLQLEPVARLSVGGSVSSVRFRGETLPVMHLDPEVDPSLARFRLQIQGRRDS